MTEMTHLVRRGRATANGTPVTEHNESPLPAHPVPLPVAPIWRLRETGSSAPHKQLKDLTSDEVRVYGRSPASFETSDQSEQQALAALVAGYAAAELWTDFGAKVDLTGAGDTDKGKFYGVVKSLYGQLERAQAVLLSVRNFELAGPMKGVSRQLDTVLRRASKETWIKAVDVSEANCRDVLLAMPKPAQQQSQGSADNLMSESEITAVINNCSEVCDFADRAKKETEHGTHKQINTALSMAAIEVRNASRRAPEQLTPVLERLDVRIDKCIRRAVTLSGADFKSCDSAGITFDVQLNRVRAKFAEPASKADAHEEKKPVDTGK